MVRLGALLILVVGGCASQQEVPPAKDEGLTVRARGRAWDARVTGNVNVRDPFGTETPDEENSPEISLRRDVDLGRPEAVRELDLAVYWVEDDGKRVGPRVRIRRGRWNSEEALEEEVDLGTIVLPQGTPIESELLHEFYAAGWCRKMEFEGGLTTWWTGGGGITRNTFRFETPQGHDRAISGGGLGWFEMEVEYAPISAAFLRVQTGLLYFPFAGMTIDAAAEAGIRWKGLSLTGGYRIFRVVELSLSGFEIGLTLEF
jgi:hypothetical protein